MNRIVLTATVKLDKCGFCGARKNAPCKEFGSIVADHSERFTDLPELFIPELDGLTAPTAEEAREWESWEQQSRAEAYAESGWLRAAENNYFSPEEGGY